MKRKILILAIITICLSFLVYGTIAYFTAEDTAHNVVTTGDIKIELLEWVGQGIPFPGEGIDGVMPGAKVPKIVEVKNTGSNAAYVRLAVEKEITLREDIEGIADPDLLSLDFDTVFWELGTDGFFYYKKALEPGETTEPLFSSLTLAPEMDNLYQNSTIEVKVKAYAVQTANQNVTNPWDALGWPAG